MVRLCAESLGRRIAIPRHHGSQSPQSAIQNLEALHEIYNLMIKILLESTKYTVFKVSYETNEKMNLCVLMNCDGFDGLEHSFKFKIEILMNSGFL